MKFSVFKGIWLPVAIVLQLGGSAQAREAPSRPSVLFQTSDRCIACHNGMNSALGEEVSIGVDWSTSMMANSSRDPYWQASVRRETIDHPESRQKIEHECSSCHMPMLQYEAKEQGLLAGVFTHLPLNQAHSKAASDGVTCSVCHQITPQNLGKPESYNGNFVVERTTVDQAHAEFGPYAISGGLQQVMRTSTGGFEPQEGAQIRSSELCASCHTLITEARGDNGAVVGALPEQMPYQEWLHSDFKSERTCQSCHMPAVNGEVPIARILAANRSGVARHQFVGSNFLMQRLLGRYRDELDVAAAPQDLSEAADRTIRYLQAESAAVALAPPRLVNGRLEEDVTVRNLGGHKMPTAYPSRRAWLHVTVRDQNGRAVFESGALNDDGSIVGNDNDADPAAFEPHYTEIRRADQVQIYEAILEDTRGKVTTGLLAAVDYVKDNRLLPRGFDKTNVPPNIAVHGDAQQDSHFNGQGHQIRYSIDVTGVSGPLQVDVELWFQPIGFRWARNLGPYAGDEPQRFSRYYGALARGSGVILAKASTVTR